MPARELHDGRRDGLEPLRGLDLQEIETFADLLRAMSSTAFSGRQLGQAFDVACAMFRDPDCDVVLTISGAMTVAKQGRIFCDLIDRGCVQAIVATGALIAHGLTESIGCVHYQYDPADSDNELYEKGYNRIYDTLEMEANLNDVEQLVRSVLNTKAPADGVWSSSQLCHALGEALCQSNVGPGILRSAYEQDVPVYIPAFTDSEIGLDVSTWAVAKAIEDGQHPSEITHEHLSRAVPPFNPFVDLQQYASRVGSAKRLGIFTVGGGVPRNWAQQVAPYYEILNQRLKIDLPMPRFFYGIRICPEPVHWGRTVGLYLLGGSQLGKVRRPRRRW